MYTSPCEEQHVDFQNGLIQKLHDFLWYALRVSATVEDGAWAFEMAVGPADQYIMAPVPFWQVAKRYCWKLGHRKESSVRFRGIAASLRQLLELVAPVERRA